MRKCCHRSLPPKSSQLSLFHLPVVKPFHASGKGKIDYAKKNCRLISLRITGEYDGEGLTKRDSITFVS